MLATVERTHVECGPVTENVTHRWRIPEGIPLGAAVPPGFVDVALHVHGAAHPHYAVLAGRRQKAGRVVNSSRHARQRLLVLPSVSWHQECRRKSTTTTPAPLCLVAKYSLHDARTSLRLIPLGALCEEKMCGNGCMCPLSCMHRVHTLTHPCFEHRDAAPRTAQAVGESNMCGMPRYPRTRFPVA